MTYMTIHAGDRNSLIDEFKRLFVRSRGDVRPAKDIKNNTPWEQALQAADRRESARRAVDTLLKRGF